MVKPQSKAVMKHNIVDKKEFRFFFKKKLNYITTKEKTLYMSNLRAECLKNSLANKNENWFAEKLKSAKLGMTRQAIWGYRIFDFWNGGKGVAIEIDGPEHDEKYDRYRDLYNYLRSGIVVLRVRNMNEDDAHEAISLYKSLGTHGARKKALGIKGRGFHPIDITNPNDPYWLR